MMANGLRNLINKNLLTGARFIGLYPSFTRHCSIKNHNHHRHQTYCSSQWPFPRYWASRYIVLHSIFITDQNQSWELSHRNHNDCRGLTLTWLFYYKLNHVSSLLLKISRYNDSNRSLWSCWPVVRPVPRSDRKTVSKVYFRIVLLVAR